MASTQQYLPTVFFKHQQCVFMHCPVLHPSMYFLSANYCLATLEIFLSSSNGKKFCYLITYGEPHPPTVLFFNLPAVNFVHI